MKKFILFLLSCTFLHQESDAQILATDGLKGRTTGDESGAGYISIWGISDQFPATDWGFVWDGDPNQFKFIGNSNERITLDMDNGNISSSGKLGIGITSPSVPFEIGSSNSSGQPIFKMSGLSNWWGIGLGTDGGNHYLIGRGSSLSERRLTIHIPNSSNYSDTQQPTFEVVSTGADQLFTIEAQTGTSFLKGNLGIGTTSTGSHKLAVEGTIGAREIKVEASGWSDFVFEKDYQLRTIEELEKYIDTNGHLPEIPSAEQVLENGIDLGNMNAKLLQKIEELTLYMIAINKQNQAHQERIQQLERQLKIAQKQK